MILMIGIFVTVSFGFHWIVKLSTQELSTRRERVRFETSEAHLMSLATSVVAPKIDTRLAQAVQGGFAEINSDEVALDIQGDLRNYLSASDQKAAFPNNPISPATVSVSYAGLAVHSTDAALDPYRATAVLALTARPFVISAPDSSIANPFQYLDYVPDGHPLKGMLVRRYPFTLTYETLRNGQSVQVSRRLSVYQVPLGQFARFSTSGMDVSQTSVQLADASAYAFGNVTGSMSGTSSRLWASQVQDLSGVSGAGSEAARAFNLSSVQQRSSRLGGRITGESWTLAAPHFFSARQAGERIDGSSRPIPQIGAPTAKAYEAQTFCEVIYDPTKVTAATPSQGALTMNVYSADGSLLTSVQGLMRGLANGDSPGFVETLLSPSGGTIGTRSSSLSVSQQLPGGAARGVSSLDLIALRAGSWSFRVTATAGDEGKIYVNGSLVGATTGDSSFALVLAAGRHDVRVEHSGSSGEVAIRVTPPTLAEAYLTQWAVPSGTPLNNQGSFGSAFSGSATFSWNFIPPGTLSNATGRENVVVTINADQPWLLGAAGGDVVLYAEGVRAGESRYYSAAGKEWAVVLFQIAGNGISADLQTRNSFTVLSPNPVVVTGDFSSASFKGLYVVSREPNSADGDTLYVGFDQASAEALTVTGVVAGVHAAARSYYDQLDSTAMVFKATAAGANETNPFFKTIVLIDDFFVQETTL